MNEFLLTLLNMSIVSCWLILALLVLRPLLKKASKAFVCALWALVGLRLVCPFTFESVLSIIPSSQPVSDSAVYSQINAFVNYGEPVNDIAVGTTQQSLVPPAGTSIITPLQAISLVAAFIWVAGVAAMLIISLVSFFRLKKSVAASVNIGSNVFINDDIASPFVFGMIRPRIYIPSVLTEYEKEFVIAHESAHIKRRDYLIKPLGYLILSLHWFNPLVWVAYILLCRDIESACDERVIKEMNDKEKTDYSEILLRLSMPKKSIKACPVAFGEVGVKMRIKSVLNYKKPAFWIIIVAVVVAAALTVGFLTNPITKNENSDYAATPYKSSSGNVFESMVEQSILMNCESADKGDRYAVADFRELNTIEFEHHVTSYIWAYYGEYEYNNGKTELAYEFYQPAVVRLYKNGDVYTIESFETVDDYRYTDQVMALFPEELHASVRYRPGYYQEQKNACLKSAMNEGYILTENSEGEEKIVTTQKINEFYPVFNAKVLEINEKNIIVAPLKGEKVSGNTFDKVRLGLKYLTDGGVPDLLYEGDMVEVRYADIISVDGDIPDIPNVFHISKLECDSFISIAKSSYYYACPEYDISKTSAENNKVKQDIITMPFFWLSEENNTYELVYMNYNVENKSNAYVSRTSGLYTEDIKYGGIVLEPFDNDTEIFYFAEIEEGGYQYSKDKSIEFGSRYTAAFEDDLIFVKAQIR